jgi:hypothetical protein
MKTRLLCILSLTLSAVGLVYSATGIPYIWEMVTHRWKPIIQGGFLDFVIMSAILLPPLLTVFLLRRYPEQRKKRIGVWTGRMAVASLTSQGLLIGTLTVLSYVSLPALDPMREFERSQTKKWVGRNKAELVKTSSEPVKTEPLPSGGESLQYDFLVTGGTGNRQVIYFTNREGKIERLQVVAPGNVSGNSPAKP